MNDNLRYVSLQYIKGENYEDVDSFKENEIRQPLNELKNADILDNPDKVEELYNGLKETPVKKKIGESFLDDLINYSSLKLIKKDLEGAKKSAENKIRDIKEKIKEGNKGKERIPFINARKSIAQSLVDVIAVIDMVKRDDISELPVEPSDTSERVLNTIRDYLLKVETAQVKITKIGDKIDALKVLVDGTAPEDKGKVSLLQFIMSDLEKLKAIAIKRVDNFKSQGKISETEQNADLLLTELNELTDNLASINIIDEKSNFKNIEKTLNADKAQAQGTPAPAALEKAKVLFSNVKFAITKLNEEVTKTNTNISKLKVLTAKIEDAKTKVAEAQMKTTLATTAAKTLTTADIRNKAAYQAAQTEAEEAKKALEASLETIKGKFEEAYKLLEELRKSVIKQSDALEKDKKDYLKSLDKLVALYSSYLNICTKNILKYDRLFEHNEISNIDEAFMIKSYSDFLKKLNKLKQNLETKDIGKIRRALTDSINQLFNMYGVNTNNEAFMKAFLEGYYDDNGTFKNNVDAVDEKKTKDIDYIIDRIINYNLAK